MRLFVSFSQSCQKSHEYALIKAARRGKGPGILVYVLLCCLLCSVQEGDDLGAGAGVVGREAAVTCAVGYAVCDCPVDGVIVERGRRNVGEAAYRARCRRILRTVQEGHDLTAGAGVVGGKAVAADSLRYAVCDRPLDRLVVECAGLNVGKAHVCADCRLACRAPKEGHDLAARALSVGVEAIIAHALGYAVLDCPLDGVCVERVGGNVGEAYDRLVIGVFRVAAGADAADVAVTQRIGVAALIAVVADRAGVGGVSLFGAGGFSYGLNIFMRVRVGILCAAADAQAVLILMAERLGVERFVALAAFALPQGVAALGTGRLNDARLVVMGVSIGVVLLFAAANALAENVQVSERVLVAVDIAGAASTGMCGVALFRAGGLGHGRFVIVLVRLPGVFCMAAGTLAVFVVVAEGISVAIDIAVAAGAGMCGVALFRAGGSRHNSIVIMSVRFVGIMDGCIGNRFIVRLNIYCIPLGLAACVIHIFNILAVAERSVAYCFNVLREAYTCERRAAGKRRGIYRLSTGNVQCLKAGAVFEYRLTDFSQL